MLEGNGGELKEDLAGIIESFDTEVTAFTNNTFGLYYEGFCLRGKIREFFGHDLNIS